MIKCPKLHTEMVPFSWYESDWGYHMKVAFCEPISNKNEIYTMLNVGKEETKDKKLDWALRISNLALSLRDQAKAHAKVR